MVELWQGLHQIVQMSSMDNTMTLRGNGSMSVFVYECLNGESESERERGAYARKS